MSVASLLIYLLAAIGLLQAVGISVIIWTGEGELTPGPLLQLQVMPSGSEALGIAGEMPLAIRVLSTLPTLTVAVTGLTAAFLLAAVLAWIARGNAFSARTRLSLARLSLTLTLGSVLSFAIDCVAVPAIRRFMDDRGAPAAEYTIASPSFPVFVFVLGIVAAALLFAFRDGAELEKEVDGVV